MKNREEVTMKIVKKKKKKIMLKSEVNEMYKKIERLREE